MKRPLLILAAMFIVVASYSQNLTGPKAKNAKISEKTKNSIAVVYYENPLDLKGPKAKNRKVWEDPEFSVTGSKARYILPKSMRPRKFWWH
jgi:hypothetical protein